MPEQAATFLASPSLLAPKVPPCRDRSEKMGLFDESIGSISDYLEVARYRGLLRQSCYDSFAVWPEKRSLVLQEDTGLELGGSIGSLFLLLWTNRRDLVRAGSISIIGPDLPERESRRLPFGLVALVQGDFQDEYDTYRDIREVIFDTHLEGVSSRFWPDSGQVWCRVSREALQKGFALNRLGGTLIKRLSALPGLEGVELVFITDQEELKRLKKPAEKVQDIVEALIKMYEEMHFDCETCEYQEVCEEVAGLKEIRDRLREKRGRQ